MSSPIISPEDFLSQANEAGVDITGGFQTNANTLRHEEWLQYDAALLKIARERLNGIADLQSRGLVKRLGSIGTILSMYERSGDMTEASISMDGMTRGQNDRLTFDQVGVPIPIFHKDHEIGIRQLEASRNRGEALDTSQMEVATRIVMDGMESALFNGIPNLEVSGKKVYGYLNHPDRNTVRLSGSGWTVTAGRDIIGDTKNMLAAAYADNHFGSFVMYVAKDIWSEIQMDYSDEKGDRTYKERIMAFDDISEVKAGDAMPNGTVLLVEMMSNTIDLAVAQDIRNVQWGANPMIVKQKVFTLLAPRVKSDVNGQSGIVHGSA